MIITQKVEDMISIPLIRYNKLIRDEAELEALHDGGVDNWDWYYESLKYANFFERFGLD